MQRHLKLKNRRGSALLEFTLVGVPLIFACISTVEMARCMWNYHTLQYAVKTATAYASMHGATCDPPNSCSVNVSDVVGVFQTTAMGIPANMVSIKLTSASSTVTCTLVSTCSSNASWSTRWPPAASGDNAIGQDIYIEADYSFKGAMAMFFPGAGSVSFGGASGFIFPGYSHQRILF
jgi:Flp pilus assembly protein TadG